MNFIALFGTKNLYVTGTLGALKIWKQLRKFSEEIKTSFSGVQKGVIQYSFFVWCLFYDSFLHTTFCFGNKILSPINVSVFYFFPRFSILLLELRSIFQQVDKVFNLYKRDQHTKAIQYEIKQFRSQVFEVSFLD